MSSDLINRLKEMDYDPSVQGFMADSYKQLGRVAVFKDVPTNAALGLEGEGNYNLSREDCDKLLRFVILFGDNQSPFAEEKDIEQKIKSCLLQLKIGTKSPVFKEVIQQGALFRKYLFEYFKIIHAIDYESWLSLKIAFHNFNNILRTPVSIADEKAVTAVRNVAKEILGIKSQLVDMEYRLFPDKRMQSMIREAAMEESISGYAERNAENLKDWLDNG